MFCKIPFVCVIFYFLFVPYGIVSIYVLLIDVLIDRLQDALITIPIQSIYRRKCGSRCSGGDSGLGEVEVGEVECVVE